MDDDQKEQTFKRYKVDVDPNYGDKIWKILEHAINEIYNHNGCRLSYGELYRHAYDMVLHNFGEKLYTGLESTMTCHLREISKRIGAAQGNLFLEEIDRKWTDHNKALQMIRDIVMYMDRTYVPSNSETPVHKLGLNLWRDIIVRSPKIKARLLETLNENILQERTGKVINQGLMRNIIKMLLDLEYSVYMDFEMSFLFESTHFYKIESQKLIECCDCGDYLKKADQRKNEEIKRVRNYLDISSEHKINSIVENEMIRNHMFRLVNMENSGLVNMFLDDKFEDLRRMYNWFSGLFCGLSTMRDVMASQLKETGFQLQFDYEMVTNPVKSVQCLLNVKDKYDKIINLAFSNDETFQADLNLKLKIIINLNPRSAKSMSLFVDYKLREGLKGVSEEDVEVILDKIVVLFRYLKEKDDFEEYYRQHLAKRLLSAKKYSDNAERSLIVKLKTECGYHFTLKLERMLTDMLTSQETMQGFCSTHGAELVDSPTLVVQVLTSGSWPTQPSLTCNLPAEMSALCEKFRSYYLGAHGGRRLSWQTNMGTAELKATFGRGQKHELNVSTYQMCVLMMFNSSDQYTYQEIAQATEIPPSELKRCLQSLACVKGKNVLQKDPMTKNIGEEDVFSVNDNFTSKCYKIKIGTVVAQLESESENPETRQRVLEAGRKPQIDAAILRIMKSRKVLDHHNIITEVTKYLQSRFEAYPSVIKKRIECLIEREYLERDGTDGNLYRYLA